MRTLFALSRWLILHLYEKSKKKFYETAVRSTEDEMTGNRKDKKIKRKKHNYDRNKKSGTEWNTQSRKRNKRLIARRRKRRKGFARAKENIGGKGDAKQKEQRGRNAGRANRDEG